MMQETYYFHLFLARIEAGKTNEYDKYILDKHKNSLFFNELAIDDYKVCDGTIENYGLEVLNPDFRYEFPLSELLKMTLLKKEDLPLVEKFCQEKGISPNSYSILYKKGLKINEKTPLSYPNLYYVGAFEMDAEALISKQILYPHLF